MKNKLLKQFAILLFFLLSFICESSSKKTFNKLVSNEDKLCICLLDNDTVSTLISNDNLSETLGGWLKLKINERIVINKIGILASFCQCTKS